MRLATIQCDAENALSERSILFKQITSDMSTPRSESTEIPNNDNYLVSNTGTTPRWEFSDQSLKKVKALPRWEFSDQGLRVKALNPVAIAIERCGELYFTVNENLCIYASGGTLEEAFQDFSRSILHFYYYYKSLPNNKVIGKARTLKKIFSEQFQEA